MANNNSSSWFKYMAWGSATATSLAGLVGGGYLLGSFFDSRWGTDPVFRIALMLLGVVLGVAYIIVSISKLGKANDEH